VTVTLRYMRHAPEAYLDQDAKAIAAHMKRDQEAQVPAECGTVQHSNGLKGATRSAPNGRGAWTGLRY